MDAKKLKLIVKGEKKPTFGTDPNEPWSVRAGITESEAGMLHAYLRSRGINPEFVGKDTKISHSKSSEFQKWKRDHMFDDPADYVSSVTREKMKAQRAQREEVEIEEGKTLQHTPVELRQHALNREKHMTKVLKHNGLHKEGFDNHEEIAKELIRRHGMNVTKDHLRALEDERDSRGALDHQAVMDKVRAMGAMTEAKKPKMTALDKFRKAAAEREKKHSQYEKPTGDLKGAIDRLEKHLNKEAADPGISKAKETLFHKKLDTLVHKTFGKRKDELKMKEDVFQDTYAATQMPFDMANQADDREPTYSKQKEMSKSARIIKSLYKKHKMVKEEIYDHEKEDKSVATYGKKPKVEKQEAYGDEDTQAAMVLKGGKTLTGQTRDTLEIDPVMRKANKNNDN